MIVKFNEITNMILRAGEYHLNQVAVGIHLYQALQIVAIIILLENTGTGRIVIEFGYQTAVKEVFVLLL